MAGGLQEAGYLKGAGAGRNGKNFATLAQYFAIGKVRGGGSRYGRGREPGVQGAGGGLFRPPCPPPLPPLLMRCLKHIMDKWSLTRKRWSDGEF